MLHIGPDMEFPLRNANLLVVFEQMHYHAGLSLLTGGSELVTGDDDIAEGKYMH